MRLHVLLLAIAIIAIPLRASADSKAKARAHMAKASTAHGEGRFAETRTELIAAYSLDPQPEILYALGQVSVKLGQCPEAITYYRRFLASKPAPEMVEMTNEAMTSCTVAPPSVAPTEPPPSGPPTPMPGDPIDNETPPTMAPGANGARWYKDPVGLGLVGGGALALVAGAIAYSSARATLDDAEAAGTYQAAAELEESARTRRLVSAVFTVAGAALVGGGVYYLVRKRRNHEAGGVGVTPTTGGGMVSWSARF